MFHIKACTTWSAEAEAAAIAEAAAWLQDGYVPCGITLRVDTEQQAAVGGVVQETQHAVTGAVLRLVRCPTLYQAIPARFLPCVAALGGPLSVDALTGLHIPSYASAQAVYGSGGTLLAVEGWGPRWLALQAGAALDQFELEPLRRLRWEAWAEAWWAEAAMGFDGRSALAMPATAASSLLEAAYRCIMPADWPKITLQRFHAWERWHGMTRTAVMVRGWEEVVQDLVQHATLWACL